METVQVVVVTLQLLVAIIQICREILKTKQSSPRTACKLKRGATNSSFPLSLDKTFLHHYYNLYQNIFNHKDFAEISSFKQAIAYLYTFHFKYYMCIQNKTNTLNTHICFFYKIGSKNTNQTLLLTSFTFICAFLYFFIHKGLKECIICFHCFCKFWKWTCIRCPNFIWIYSRALIHLLFQSFIILNIIIN